MSCLPLLTADKREKKRNKLRPPSCLFSLSPSPYLEAVEVELEGSGGGEVLEVHVVGLAVLGVGHGHGRLLRVHQHGRVAAQRAVPGRQVQLERRREGGEI